MSINQNMGARDYELLKKKQLMLAGIADQAKDAVAALNMVQYSDNLGKMRDKIANDSFKIQIVGTFKNGKSTFINSFLGEEILPAYTLPCTAVINEVKYGSEKRAVLHFCDPLPESWSPDIPEKALMHMKKYNMQHIPPIEIPYDEIEDYVVIPIGKDAKEALKESPYSKVELFWPMELLKNGVEIIDSPGLNEAEARTKVTMDYLTKADAIIFLLRVDALCSAEEMKFVEYNLKGQGFDNPFFIINRFDLIQRDRDKQQIKNFAYNKLRDYTNFGESGFFFVSALKALDGKTDGDQQEYLSSGMADFEKRLSQFLTRERGMAKLSQPAKELKRILNSEAIDKILPQQRALLETSLDEIKSRYAKAAPKLDELQRKKENLQIQLELRINNALPDIKKCVSKYYVDLVDSVTSWCNTCSVNMALKGKASYNAAAEEIANYVNEQIEGNQAEWRNNALIPLIDEKITEIFGSIEPDVQRLFDEIDSIQVELSGKGNVNTSDGVPTWQRIVGTVGGWALGGLSGAQAGNMFGLSKDFAKSIGLQLGSWALLAAFGFLNPVTILASIAGMMLFNQSSAKDKALKKIREAVSNEMITQINAQREESVDGIVNGVGGELMKLANTITDSVDIEINEVNNQIQEVIAEMEKGQANIEARKAELADREIEIKKLITETDDFIYDLLA